jgi:hypothetical protein
MPRVDTMIRKAQFPVVHPVFYKGAAAEPVSRQSSYFARLPHCAAGVVGVDPAMSSMFLLRVPVTIADPAGHALTTAWPRWRCAISYRSGKQGTWWASKGNHVFGVPDFALWDNGRFGLKPVQSIFALAIQLPAGWRDHSTQGGNIDGIEWRELCRRRGDGVPRLCGPGKTIALRPSGVAAGSCLDAAVPTAGCRERQALKSGDPSLLGTISNVPPHGR